MNQLELLEQQAIEIIEGEEYLSPCLANLSALIFTLTDISWSGFYMVTDNKLVLQCFCGLPACSVIELDRGVCGCAATTKSEQNIPNVHDFDGHIACDSRSCSELVLPIFCGSQVVGVLDVDSIKYSRFDEQTHRALSRIVTHLSAKLNKLKKKTT